MKPRLLWDAGHGGSDPGAISGDFNERDLVWFIADEADNESERLGYDSIETRDLGHEGDTLKKDKKRRKAMSDGRVLISVHLNSFHKETANGAEVFISKNPSPLGHAMAERSLGYLAGLGFRNRGIKQRDFLVLTWVPDAILIEVGFITNSDDLAKFDTEEEGRKIGKGLAQAMHQVFSDFHMTKDDSPKQMSQATHYNVLRTALNYANQQRQMLMIALGEREGNG